MKLQNISDPIVQHQRNGILLPKLFLPTVRKKYSIDPKKICNLQNF